MEKHRITMIDTARKAATCSVCGPNTPVYISYYPGTTRARGHCILAKREYNRLRRPEAMTREEKKELASIRAEEFEAEERRRTFIAAERERIAREEAEEAETRRRRLIAAERARIAREGDV